MTHKVFITGAGGFLGRALALQCLERGYEVYGVARSHYPELQALGVKMRRADIASADAFIDAKGCNAIFHVAAKAGAWGHLEDYHSANVLGTIQALEAAKRYHVPKFIFTSSPSVVHAGGDIEGLSETDLDYPQHFSAHYPATKAQAERLVLQAQSEHLSVVALRPHLIWGPGDQHLIPRILSRADQKRLRHLAPHKLVDSVYIDDAARAHLNAFDSLTPGARCAGKAYFISQGEPWEIQTLMNGILEACGRAPVYRTMSPKLAYKIGATLEVLYRWIGADREPPMTRFIAEQLSTAHWFDITAARNDLGYQPERSIRACLDVLAQTCTDDKRKVIGG